MPSCVKNYGPFIAQATEVPDDPIVRMYAELEYGISGMWELPYGQSFGQDISRM